MTSDITIRPCKTLEDLRRCVELEKRIWGYAGEDVVPLSIFVVALHTGGHVYGAFDGEQQVAFALAFSANEGDTRYLHSHMVGVIPEYQNRNIGRQMKLFQRREALTQGIALIKWTFDPLELRNAHFNICRLGATIRRYVPNCYGTSSSPLHAHLPTDRFVAEWWLSSARVKAVLSQTAPLVNAEAVEEIRVPANIAEIKRDSPEQAREIQTHIRERCAELFARGYAITGFELAGDTARYLLERYAN